MSNTSAAGREPVRVSTAVGHYTTTRAVAEAAGLNILSAPAVDRNGRWRKAVPRRNLLGNGREPEDYTVTPRLPDDPTAGVGALGQDNTTALGDATGTAGSTTTTGTAGTTTGA